MMSFLYMFGFGVCFATGAYVGCGLIEGAKKLIGRYIHIG